MFAEVIRFYFGMAPLGMLTKGNLLGFTSRMKGAARASMALFTAVISVNLGSSALTFIYIFPTLKF